jgi:K+-transporting ATPase ATPase C chain
MSGFEESRDGTWRSTLRPAVVLVVAFTAVTLAYTVVLAGVARFIGGTPPGDLVLDADRTAAWSGPEWFHGRPTAATGGVSGGSNLGPTNPALAAAVAERVAAVKAENPAHAGPIPIDLVTTSASGLDPHVSPAAARLQVARVAAARGLTAEVVRDLVERTIEPRSLGVFGQPRVNVVRLNEALRALDGPKREAFSGTAP